MPKSGACLPVRSRALPGVAAQTRMWAVNATPFEFHRPLRSIWWSLGVVVHLLGCTTLRIEAGEGQVKVERHWGMLVVNVGTEAPHAAQLTSFGISNTPLGFTAGFASQTWLHMPGDDCRVVLWIDSAAQLDAAKAWIETQPQVCSMPAGMR